MPDGVEDMHMDIIKGSNLALRFLLELGILAALAVWGFHSVQGMLGKMAVGIGVPLLVAILWGMFLAPASSLRLEGLLYLILEVVIFGVAAAALYATDHVALAWALVLIAVINKVLMVVWGQ
jgi:hypothetical protein